MHMFKKVLVLLLTNLAIATSALFAMQAHDPRLEWRHGDTSNWIPLTTDTGYVTCNAYCQKVNDKIVWIRKSKKRVSKKSELDRLEEKYKELHMPKSDKVSEDIVTLVAQDGKKVFIDRGTAHYSDYISSGKAGSVIKLDHDHQTIMFVAECLNAIRGANEDSKVAPLGVDMVLKVVIQNKIHEFTSNQCESFAKIAQFLQIKPLVKICRELDYIFGKHKQPKDKHVGIAHQNDIPIDQFVSVDIDVPESVKPIKEQVKSIIQVPQPSPQPMPLDCDAVKKIVEEALEKHQKETLNAVKQIVQEHEEEKQTKKRKRQEDAEEELSNKRAKMMVNGIVITATLVSAYIVLYVLCPGFAAYADSCSINSVKNLLGGYINSWLEPAIEKILQIKLNELTPEIISQAAGAVRTLTPEQVKDLINSMLATPTSLNVQAIKWIKSWYIGS